MFHNIIGFHQHFLFIVLLFIAPLLFFLVSLLLHPLWTGLYWFHDHAISDRCDQLSVIVFTLQSPLCMASASQCKICFSELESKKTWHISLWFCQKSDCFNKWAQAAEHLVPGMGFIVLAIQTNYNWYYFISLTYLSIYTSWSDLSFIMKSK